MTGSRRRLGWPAPLRWAAATALVGLTLTAGCAVDLQQSPQTAAGSDSGRQVNSTSTRQIVLRFDQQAVPATLADGAAAREFAAMLPLTLDLSDPMGQAKSGRLPIRLSADDTDDTDDTDGTGDTGDELTTDPAAGGIYYVPRSGTVAIFYLDLGQSVPDGLIRLGTVDGDLPAVADAGQRMLLRIYPIAMDGN